MWRFVVLLLLLVPSATHAYAPTFVHPASSDAVISVPDDGLLHTYYGTLQDYPHTYQVTATQTAALHVQILIPNSAAVPNNRNGIIVRNEERGVSLVVRLGAATAPWTVLHDGDTHDTYRRGGSYDSTIKPGTYKIEVSTGDNQGPYVLQIGVGVPGTDIYPQPHRSFWQRFGDTYQIKHFLHDPVWSYFLAPVYFLSLLLLLMAGGGVYYYRKKRYAA